MVTPGGQGLGNGAPWSRRCSGQRDAAWKGNGPDCEKVRALSGHLALTVQRGPWQRRFPVRVRAPEHSVDFNGLAYEEAV